jgi:hypothetical protein
MSAMPYLSYFSNEIKRGFFPHDTFINLHSISFFGVLFMAKKNKSAKGIPVRADAASVEKETIRRVDRTIATIGKFLAKWDASDIKPKNMLPEIVRIRKFHDALLSWQRDAVRAQGREDEESRLRRLHDFVVMCNSYS